MFCFKSNHTVNLKPKAILTLECKSCFKIIDSYNYYKDVFPIIYFKNKFSLNYYYYKLFNYYLSKYPLEGVYNYIELIKLMKCYSVKKQYKLLENLLIDSDLSIFNDTNYESGKYEAYIGQIILE